jgi:imidazolonepropionase-like amidohydrolase
MQALRAATQWAAPCLGLERKRGTILKDRLADIVSVNGNPSPRLAPPSHQAPVCYHPATVRPGTIHHAEA